jgi:hypothetical protein
MLRWMHLWLFAVGILVALVLLSINSLVSDLAAFAWGFVVVPHGAVWLLRRRRIKAGVRKDPSELELQGPYWRTGNWQSGSH